MLAVLVLALAGPPRPAPVQDQDQARRFNARRVAIHGGGMGVLTGWSLVNLGLGLGLGFTTDGPARHFHQMNAYWNTVNLALGVGGLVGVRREDRGLALPAAVSRARKHRSLFTWNGALDVLYVTTGAVLWNLGQTREHERLIGYGASIMLQGGFLFAFDLTMAALHARNLRRVAAAPIAGVLPGGGLTVGLRGAF